MHFGIFAAFTVLVGCLHAGPIKKRSSGSNAVEFEMSSTNYNSMSWKNPNSTLTAISTDSKNSFPGSSIQCPSEVLEGNDVPLYRRSTCPWYYEVDHVSTRYPATILTAHPACLSCIGASEYQCVAIMRTIKVLEKHTDIADIVGAVQFVESEMEIAVGFTCAGLPTASNSNSNTATTAAAAGSQPDFAK